MIQVDLYTMITLFFAVALVVIGVELLFKHIPKGNEFAKLRILRNLVAAVYLVAAVFASVEFLFWRKYHFETAAFFNLSTAAYQFVLCTVAITTCFNPAFTSLRKIVLWLGITTAWVVPLGIFNYLGQSWAVYAIFVAYVLQIAVGVVLFYRNYREDISLIKATNTNHKIDLRWLNIGTWYMIIYSVVVGIISCLPPIAHIVFTLLTVVCYIGFTTRFSALSDRIYRDYFPVLTEAGLTDVEPKQVEGYSRREEHCRQAVEEWVARKGFCAPDPDRDSAAEKMGLSKEDLQWYFSVCMKAEFRSWRVKLRIEEAKNILLAHPDAPVNELARSLGFNSKTNFFAHFKKIIGVTTQEFIAQHRS